MEQRTGKAFASAHISGIFIVDLKKITRISGSMGCGLCLEHGAITEVSPAGETTIKLNGVMTETPTTLSALELLTSEPVLVETALDVPVGCGFGTSGAGALSTVLALNEALSLNKTVNELAQAAHTAEVENRTGLGDVAAQVFGGAVIRKKAGVSSGNIDWIPCRDDVISRVSFGEISTGSILSDDLKKENINKKGKFRLKELLKKPTLENFFIQSCAFAREIELMSPDVEDAIEAVEAGGGLASQAMLGDTVFAVNDRGALSEFGEVHSSRINYTGAHLL